MASSPTTLPHGREPHSIPFTLVMIALAVGMVGLSLAYGVEVMVTRLKPDHSAEAAAPVSRSVVGKQLTIPAAWVRGAVSKQQGFSTEVSLEVMLPLGKNGTEAPVEVTLVPLSQVRPSASLLDGVYLHQFMPNELSGPPGLVGKPLYGTDGYENEAVWYDALSQNPFVAKCLSPPDGQSGPARCLRTVALPGGIAAIYAFDADLLGAWQRFDTEMQPRLQQIGAL
jgi:hypothetical protein